MYTGGMGGGEGGGGDGGGSLKEFIVIPDRSARHTSRGRTEAAALEPKLFAKIIFCSCIFTTTKNFLKIIFFIVW